jgi:hypothetical protein
LPTPTVTLVKDEKKAGSPRHLQLHVQAPAGETSVFVRVSSQVNTTQASVNGKEIVKNGTTERFQFGTDWGVRYYAPPATGIDLTLELESDSPVKVQVIGLSHGLPEIGNIEAKYKPQLLMPAPYLHNNSTMVAKTFSFN